MEGNIFAGAEKRNAAGVLVFRIGGELCALPAERVREIVPMAQLARSPGQPSVLEGFLNLRGTAVPVIDLRRLFDLDESEPGIYAHIIVLKGGEHATGLLADRALALVRPAPADWLPLKPEDSFNRCSEAALLTSEGVAQCLSPEHLLLEKEKHAVADLQARAQRYLGDLEAREP